MIISLQAVSKRFNYDWIFRDLHYTFSAPKKIAVTGANGSGKSTLMRILSGQLSPSEGKVVFTMNNTTVELDHVYRHIAFAAPYMELIEDFSLQEQVRFQQKFKPLISGISIDQCIEIAQLFPHRNKLIKNYSSGMKQRVKLMLALCSDTPVVLLDEPATNLDAAGVAWYQDMIARFTAERMVVVSSNIEREYAFCEEILVIENYKK